MNNTEFSKKRFITNIIFGQKLINDLSINKKKNVKKKTAKNITICIKVEFPLVLTKMIDCFNKNDFNKIPKVSYLIFLI